MLRKLTVSYMDEQEDEVRLYSEDGVEISDNCLVATLVYGHGIARTMYFPLANIRRAEVGEVQEK